MLLNWKACGTTNEMRKKRHILFGSGRGSPRCKRSQNCCFVSLIKKQTVSSSSIGCAPSSTSFITALHIESQRSRSKSNRLRQSIQMVPTSSRYCTPYITTTSQYFKESSVISLGLWRVSNHCRRPSSPIPGQQH